MYASILGTRAWTPRCLQKWPRHPPTDKATYGFTLRPCWKDRKKIPSTPAASNCQTLAGLLQLHPRELDQQPDIPATDVERVPGSCQDQQWPRRLAQWPHRRAKGRSQLPLYILIQLLHREAALVNMQIRLVSDKKLKRHQRSNFRAMQRRLFDL